MTNNHGYGDNKVCEPDIDCAKCESKHPKPKKILLECGEGAGSRTFISSNDAPFQLAHVTIDTTCLNRSEVLTKFSSLVRVERLGGGATVRLQYELSRACEDGSPISLGTWIFEKVNISTADFDRAAEESFNFIFCECSACPGCCDYFVTVTPMEITNATATISNGRMAALSQSVKDSSKDKCKIYETKDEYGKSRTKLFESKKTVLECGTGDGSVIFRTENQPPVRIANVIIDTSRLRKPKVLIEFSTIVDYFEGSTPDSTVRFQFELFKVCDGEEAISRGVWNYEVGVIQGLIKATQGFGFTFCECLDFSGCCEYFVTVTAIEVPMGGLDNSTINNSRMTALAQSSKTGDKICNTTDCKLKNSGTNEVLLECGSGTGSRTFTSPNDSAFQLAQVTVDTKGLCKPTVNIEFSSIVSFEELDGDLNALLRYELFRVCEDGRAESKGVWTLAKLSQNSTKITESFDFTFCEPTKCKSDCCTYFVEVTPVEISDGQVTVSNGEMAALVGERQ
ncbi:DUF4489 domain-containing protein [Wukongibacter baidiensis]|uniref:DUF4489 domain-containing protein n=1 Tax=Wukongibacter baidiensis TaxID=1723361 RepID=UPI003D7F7E1E